MCALRFRVQTESRGPIPADDRAFIHNLFHCRIFGIEISFDAFVVYKKISVRTDSVNNFIFYFSCRYLFTRFRMARICYHYRIAVCVLNHNYFRNDLRFRPVIF